MVTAFLSIKVLFSEFFNDYAERGRWAGGLTTAR